jgi:hypothetical protein
MDLLEPRLHAHGHELSQVLAFIRGSDGSATFGFALFDLLHLGRVGRITRVTRPEAHVSIPLPDSLRGWMARGSESWLKNGQRRW